MLESVFKKNRRSAIYIAEIGLNHNGNMDVARKMVNAAVSAGADAVKFQTIVPEYLNSIYTTSLLGTGLEGERDMSQIDFFRKFILSKDEYVELKKSQRIWGVFFSHLPLMKNL